MPVVAIMRCRAGRQTLAGISPGRLVGTARAAWPRQLMGWSAQSQLRPHNLKRNRRERGHGHGPLGGGRLLGRDAGLRC